MKVRDIMTTDVEVCPPGATIQDVARRMSELDTGFIPIGDGRHAAGVITDRDIVLRVVAEGRPLTTPASEVMTSQIEYCRLDDDLQDVAEKMSRLQMRRMLILDDQRQIQGVVSLGDLARDAKAKQSGHVLADVSEPGDRLQH